MRFRAVDGNVARRKVDRRNGRRRTHERELDRRERPHPAQAESSLPGQPPLHRSCAHRPKRLNLRAPPGPRKLVVRCWIRPRWTSRRFHLGPARLEDGVRRTTSAAGARFLSRLPQFDVQDERTGQEQEGDDQEDRLFRELDLGPRCKFSLTDLDS